MLPPRLLLLAALVGGTVAADDSGGGGVSTVAIACIVAAVLVVLGAGAYVLHRRNATASSNNQLPATAARRMNNNNNSSNVMNNNDFYRQAEGTPGRGGGGGGAPPQPMGRPQPPPWQQQQPLPFSPPDNTKNQTQFHPSFASSNASMASMPTYAQHGFQQQQQQQQQQEAAGAEAALAQIQNDRVVMAKHMQFGRIQLLNNLTRGTHGEVWLAEYNSTRVAIKRLLQGTKLAPEDIALFVSEICLTASLDHPNIIAYRGVAWQGSAATLCLAMDYHAKGDLQRLLKKYGSMMSWDQDKTIVAVGIAKALFYLHDRPTPIIHRDVKGKNVLLKDSFDPVLIDFGVSRDRDQETMTAGVGTPYWVAPELLKGTKYDERSDIYSFGVFLTELDTCQMPYHDATDPKTGKELRPLQVLQMVLKGAVVPSLSRNCPPHIEEIARRCLDHDAQQRPSARELIELLQGRRPAPVPTRGSPVDLPKRTAPIVPVPDQALAPLAVDEAVTALWIPFDDLQFVRLLSKGANGEIWLASYQGNQLAAKRLVQDEKIEKEDVDLFVGEIKLTASLNHPNIIRYRGVSWSTTTKSLAMVMDYHSKGDLLNLLSKFSAMMSWDQDKLGVAVGVASALQYLHDRPTPIIHRDIKSKNVVLTDQGEPVLIDFGVSRDRDQETMTAGVGTPYWVAPELLKGTKYDERSDIYSFGVFLSELDTGNLPYSDATDPRTGKNLRPLQILQMVLKNSITPSFRPNCPPHVLAAARRCLDHDVNKRPSAQELVALLQNGSQPPNRGVPDRGTQISASGAARASRMPPPPDALYQPLVEDGAVASQFVPFEHVEFVRMLSRGAHGEVWLASIQGQQVAMKRLLQDEKIEREDMELFVGEIKLTASLTHPNIIRYRGVSWSSTAKSLCMAMDFHTRGDLEKLLKKFGAMMSWDQDKLGVAVGVASALEYLHDRPTPIIHRDVKAKNVLLTEKYEAVLIDFGVSRDRDQETMTAGVGTPYWVAPELLKGTKYDERSDIYSFGVFLTELDTAQMPYSDAKDERTGKEMRPLQVLQMVLKGAISPSFSATCPPPILDIGRRCLSHNAAERPSARELVSLLQRSNRGTAYKSAPSIAGSVDRRMAPQSQTTFSTRSVVPPPAPVMAPVPDPMMEPLTLDAAVTEKWVRFERLDFDRMLSRGAHGEVWTAMMNGELVAVKRLLQTERVDREDMGLFVGEILLTASLNHPNIIRYRAVSWGSAPNSLSMAMDYHAKGDLEKLLKKFGAMMSWEQDKTNVAVGIASALQYLHERPTPIIHRDVKAKNVLITDSFEAVLIDFGVSRDRDQETMTAGVGTPYWVAPELLMGTKYDERSDIYSFGVFLSELDTCQMPYSDAKDERNGKELRPLQILQMVLKNTISPSFSASCPPHVLSIARRCLSHDANERPSPRELIAVLRGRPQTTLNVNDRAAVAPPNAALASNTSIKSSRFSSLPPVPDSKYEPLAQDSAVTSHFLPFEKIEFIRALTRGAHGEVWLASFQGNQIAVKRLLQSERIEPEDMELFVGEIKLTASLSHPNIIRYRGVSWSSTSKSLCMAMDLHGKGDLQKVLRKLGRMMTWAQDKLSVAIGIANALQYLHDRPAPIIHRDVKAKNVLLSDNFDPVLIDFGVSRDRSQETMTAGVGTPFWVAPEMLKGIKYDERSDIYSFGVFLSELDTCELPYHDAKDPKTGKEMRPLQVLQMVLKGAIVPSFGPDCPRQVLDIARRCLESDAANRPSAKQLVTLLRSVDVRETSFTL